MCFQSERECTRPFTPNFLCLYPTRLKIVYIFGIGGENASDAHKVHTQKKNIPARKERFSGFHICGIYV